MKKQAAKKPVVVPAVMTVRELSAYLHVHPSTIYRLLKRREIPAFRINSDWRFHIRAIDKWRSQMEAEGTLRAKEHNGPPGLAGGQGA